MRKLTPRQRDVLRIIADAGHAGTVLNTNDNDVAGRIWNSGRGLIDYRLIDYRWERIGNRERLVWVATERGVKEADS